jgi:hypothetical protein
MSVSVLGMTGTNLTLVGLKNQPCPAVSHPPPSSRPALPPLASAPGSRLPSPSPSRELSPPPSPGESPLFLASLTVLYPSLGAIGRAEGIAGAGGDMWRSSTGQQDRVAGVGGLRKRVAFFFFPLRHSRSGECGNALGALVDRARCGCERTPLWGSNCGCRRDRTVRQLMMTAGLVVCTGGGAAGSAGAALNVSP